MLFLTTLLTKATTSSYINPTKEALNEAKQLLNFLENVKPSKMPEGVSFSVEAAKDEDGKIYSDIDVTINAKFTLDENKYLVSTSGIAINVQPLINFLRKVTS